VEDIVPKAAWHWGRDNSVVNNPLGEPVRTPLYVGLRLCRAPWTVTLWFFSICRAPFWGLRQIYEYMNEWNGSGDGVSLSMGTLSGNMEGARLAGTLTKDKKRYIKRDVKMPCKHRGPVGEPGGDSLAGTF